LRKIPPGTGGRGSYGHRHKTQEEIYLVLAGTVTFKVGGDVFEAGPGTAVRIPPAELRSVHNDTDADAELVISSTRVDDIEAETITEDGFWLE
jgi:quercetin dioxygenase-like cupin family protein